METFAYLRTGRTIARIETAAAASAYSAVSRPTRTGSARRDTNSRNAFAEPSACVISAPSGTPAAVPASASRQLCKRYIERICPPLTPRLLSTEISASSVSRICRETMNTNAASRM